MLTSEITCLGDGTQEQKCVFLDRSALARHERLSFCPLLLLQPKLWLHTCTNIQIDLVIKWRLESARDSVYNCRLMQRICQRLRPMHSPNRVLHGCMLKKCASCFPATTHNHNSRERTINWATTNFARRHLCTVQYFIVFPPSPPQTCIMCFFHALTRSRAPAF